MIHDTAFLPGAVTLPYVEAGQGEGVPPETAAELVPNRSGVGPESAGSHEGMVVGNLTGRVAAGTHRLAGARRRHTR
jgi:hypothetical protein